MKNTYALAISLLALTSNVAQAGTADAVFAASSGTMSLAGAGTALYTFGVVLEGYDERLPGTQNQIDRRSVEYLEYVVRRVTELRRGLDYLETRAEIDPRRIVFVSPSAGARVEYS